MKLEIGLLYRGSVRDYLKEAEFYGEIDEWKEIKGVLDSKFLIRGASAGVRSHIMAWINDKITHLKYSPSAQERSGSA